MLHLRTGRGEAVDDCLHQGGEFGCDGLAGWAGRGHQGELAHHVVDVRLGGQQQVSRYVAELDVELKLGVLEVTPRGEERVDIVVIRRGRRWRGPSVAAQLSPHDLAAWSGAL